MRRLQTALFPRLLSRTQFVAVAEHVAQGLTDECRIPRSRICVIENGVAIPETATPRADGPVRIGMLARLDPGKGVHTFIEAADATRETIAAEFALGGHPGPFEDYGRRMRETALAAGIELVDPGAGGVGFLQTLDVGAMPSRYEGSPLVLLEAMSFGKAVVASDIPGIREVIGSDAGILVPTDDAASLAEAFSTLAADADLRTRLGNRAREVVSARYSVDRMLNRLISTLEKVSAA
jgi:glycosyltransferase involved in cell wall biosynthesis